MRAFSSSHLKRPRMWKFRSQIGDRFPDTKTEHKWRHLTVFAAAAGPFSRPASGPRFGTCFPVSVAPAVCAHGWLISPFPTLDSSVQGCWRLSVGVCILQVPAGNWEPRCGQQWQPEQPAVSKKGAVFWTSFGARV